MNFEEINDFAEKNEKKFPFSSLAIGELNFTTKKIKVRYFGLAQKTTLFDLASLTKPLCLAVPYLCNVYSPKNRKDFDLLINHKAGLPAWGLLSKNSWRERIGKIALVDSPGLYSDYSALRAQMLLEAEDSNIFQKLQNFWGEDVKFWTELSEEEKERCAPTGFRNRQMIKGEVHDDNAFRIKAETMHAGLFSTLDHLLEAFLKFEKKFGFFKEFKKLSLIPEDRFVGGFDTRKLAPHILGHLGFTGTSFWISKNTGIGQFILSNATERYWYEKELINKLRLNIFD